MHEKARFLGGGISEMMKIAVIQTYLGNPVYLANPEKSSISHLVKL